MDKLPVSFAGRAILSRAPYTMPGTVVIDANAPGYQFPSGVFTHGTTKPFEIHRVVPYVVALDSNGVPYASQPPQDFLRALTQVSILAYNINEQLTKSAQDLITLVNAQTGAWELDSPFNLILGEGLQVSVTNRATTAIIGGAYAKSQVSLTFQGSLLHLDPSR